MLSLSPWFLTLFVVVFTIVSVLSYKKIHTGNRKGWRILLTLRLLLFSVVLLIFADITLPHITKLKKLPQVSIYFDNSVSAAHHPSLSPDALKNGYVEIISAIEEQAADINNDVQIKLYSFGSEIRELQSISEDIDFTEPSTDLYSIMDNDSYLAADRYVAGVVLITDGQITSGSESSKIVSEKGFPVHIVGFGDKTPIVDIHLENVDAPTVAVRGDQVTATAMISAVGNFRENVHVTLRKGSDVLGTKTIKLTGQGSLRTVRFQFQLNELGENMFNVQVSSLRRETNIKNNRSSFKITALNDRFRVALITGAVSPNSGLIKRILESEKRFSVDHYVKTKSGWSKSIAMFWRTDYDLVILDNAPSKNMSGRWVEDLVRKLDRKETSLAFIIGSSVEEKLLPQVLSILGLQVLFTKTAQVKGKPHFNQDAMLHPLFSGFSSKLNEISLPPITLSISVEPNTKSVKTVAIIEGTTESALLTLGVQKKSKTNMSRRVAAFLSSELWSLYYKTLRFSDQQFVQLWWKRLFNWLAGTTGKETLYFRLNKTSYQQGEPVYVNGTILSLENSYKRKDQVTMTVTDKDGMKESVYLSYFEDENQWKGGFHAFQPGEYHYAISVLESESEQQMTSGAFTVEESQVELNRVYLARQTLETLSEKSGGSYHSWFRREDVANKLELNPREDVLFSTRKISHWIPLSIVVLVLLTTEWILRRKWGLQ